MSRRWRWRFGHDQAPIIGDRAPRPVDDSRRAVAACRTAAVIDVREGRPEPSNGTTVAVLRRPTAPAQRTRATVRRVQHPVQATRAVVSRVRWWRRLRQVPNSAATAPRVEIRSCRGEDLPLLERRLPSGPGQEHEWRYAIHQAGLGIYLISHLDDEPVGHLLLTWAGSDDPAVRRRVRACPEISAVEVVAGLRSRGLGSRLIGYAEELAQARGYSVVGLAVTTDNNRAKALYGRLGYTDLGIGSFVHRWTRRTAGGRDVHFAETDVFLVKPLPSQRAAADESAVAIDVSGEVRRGAYATEPSE